ncbi:MAG: nicotinate-nucleotide adenylyltransferase [Deltaproteobacteria bacterium]|nr:nicotinate-nucleotide adenylyltransferase [Deltaproteobacteria bacterium]
MRTGIMGGTFNPIHNGHLKCAEELLSSCKLDRVIFIPAAQPPHKNTSDIDPFEHRYSMVKRAILPYRHFEVSDVEAQREGKSYTVETLAILHQLYPDDQFYFLIGMDSLNTIHTWHNYSQLFELCHLVVARRPRVKMPASDTVLPVAIRHQFCYDSELNSFCHSSGQKLIFLEQTFLDISSTQIRNNVANNLSVSALLPATVAEYIKTHHLYVRPER